jgi:hypothetical protein
LIGSLFNGVTPFTPRAAVHYTYQHRLLCWWLIQVETVIPHCLSGTFVISLVARATVLLLQSPDEIDLDVTVLGARGKRVTAPVQCLSEVGIILEELDLKEEKYACVYLQWRNHVRPSLKIFFLMDIFKFIVLEGFLNFIMYIFYSL